jgi:hypothetical protein
MAGMERNVFESENRAVVYLDLLGFAALVEASPKHFMTKPSDIVSSQTLPSNPAAERLAAFHEIIDSEISAEQPNHAMVFSDCAFGVFYTPTACADFAAVLMQDFLRAQVPVRMGLGFGTFHAGGTSTRFAENSTVVRSMFGGTSVVRAVTAEGCGGKGMRIFAHSSFSELYAKIKSNEHHRELVRVPSQLKSVSYEVDFAHGRDPKEVSELIGNIQQMARSLPDEVQDHYSETLRALSRMVGENGENNSELS